MTLITDRIKPKLNFNNFLEWEVSEEGKYELIDGEIVRILPTRKHEDIADLIEDAFRDQVKQFKLNYRVSGRILIRTLTSEGQEQGRQPDVTVVDKSLWESNPSAYSAFREPPLLTVEVVSTNWEDDYVDKLDEYQRLEIPEYWIIDYLAIASRNYLGKPKLPSVFVHLLDENKSYQKTTYRGGDRILSRTFPELNLTVDQILSN
jgi:Uma2 family endonuclease